MHNLDFLYFLIFWGVIIAGFGLGFYTGIVAVVAVSKYVKKQKPPLHRGKFWCHKCKKETLHEEYVIFTNEDGHDEKGLTCLECDKDNNWN